MKNSKYTKDFIEEDLKINDQFSLKTPKNNFKLIDYTWNGGDDFNYNIFNNELYQKGNI